MVRRRYITTSPAIAPRTNGIRQPQAYICASVSSDCITIITSRVASWPTVIETYWKLE